MLLCSYFRFRQRITARLVYHCLLRQIYVVLRTLYPAVTGNSLTDTLSKIFKNLNGTHTSVKATNYLKFA